LISYNFFRAPLFVHANWSLDCGNSPLKSSYEILHKLQSLWLLHPFSIFYGFIRLWILQKSEQKWPFSSSGVSRFHSLPVTAIFLYFPSATFHPQCRSDLHRPISSSLCSLLALIPLVLSFCFFIIPSYQLDFLTLMLIRVSFPFFHLVFIEPAFRNSGSFLVQFIWIKLIKIYNFNWSIIFKVKNEWKWRLHSNIRRTDIGLKVSSH
jgi:hypothetical protein